MTYGTVTLTPGERAEWAITCVPHVRVRLKRVFARIDKAQHGTLTMRASTENSFELRWFLLRYPMAMSDGDRRELEQRSTSHEAIAAAVEAITDGGYVPRPFALAIAPRAYQAQAADLVLTTGALLCADDVGLGKTVTAIAALVAVEARPALVATPAHLQRQWVRELERFAPTLRVHTLKKGTPYALHKAGLFADFPDVIVTSYHKLAGWADTLAPLVRAVVFDEVQELRRSDSGKYRAAAHLARFARYRLGLSATPIYNYGGELFSVLDVLAPDALGARAEFGREWCSGQHCDEKARVREPATLGRYLRERGLLLRRTRRDVGRELPDVSRVVQSVDADLAALDQVSVTAAELARTILAQTETFRGEKLRASEELSMILRQATGIAKAPYVAAFVRLLVESGERVVLYGWHHAVYDVWREALADLKPVCFTGQQSPAAKEAARRTFCDGQSRVLIMSLRAGAGLDGLQAVSRTVVFGELDWSPGVHEQCVGRVHRDGQPEPVMAYFLVADVGSDPVVADVLGLKAQQAAGIRDPDADAIARLTIDEGHVRRLAEQYLRAAHPVQPPTGEACPA